MDILNEMSENYTNCLLGRAIINLIPGGSAIDIAITQTISFSTKTAKTDFLFNTPSHTVVSA